MNTLRTVWACLWLIPITILVYLALVLSLVAVGRDETRDWAYDMHAPWPL